MGFYPTNISGQIPNGSITSAQLATGVLKNVKPTTITGDINSSNQDFTLGNTPASGTTLFIFNGSIPYAQSELSLLGNVVTISTAPQTGDILTAQITY